MTSIQLSLAVAALAAFASAAVASDRCPAPGTGPGVLYQEDGGETDPKKILLEEEEDEEPDCE